MQKDKIIDIEKAAKLASEFRRKKTKVILCHGVFDLLHIGHIKHLQEAKNLGGKLFVSITEDKNVKKGSNRPAFNQNLREEALAALESVDYVFTNKWPTAINTIKKVKPNIYCKGPDYKSSKDDLTGMINREKDALNLVKGKIKYTESETFSSSNLLNQHSNILNNQQKEFLKKINKIVNFNKIKELIDNFKKMKVLVVGETIIDEYAFCEALGKSGKEPVLVLRDLKKEKYVGGAAAVSRHISDFCSSITLLTMIGEDSSYKDFIKKNLQNNIKFDYIKKDSSPTIYKKRYVDHINNNKILGVYSLNDKQLNKKNEEQLERKLEKLIPRHDLVILSDYGHGFINKKLANKILKSSSFTALNTQINSSNIGHHSIEKYKKIECVIINVDELRHELRDKDSDIKDLMKNLCKKRHIINLIVTKGKKGAVLYNSKKNNFFTCPAFANTVVDKVGSGDAMLALTSLSIQKKYNPLISLYIGSLAASQSVETMGNKENVSKKSMLKIIKHLSS